MLYRKEKSKWRVGTLVPHSCRAPNTLLNYETEKQVVGHLFAIDEYLFLNMVFLVLL